MLIKQGYVIVSERGTMFHDTFNPNLDVVINTSEKRGLSPYDHSVVKAEIRIIENDCPPKPNRERIS